MGVCSSNVLITIDDMPNLRKSSPDTDQTPVQNKMQNRNQDQYGFEDGGHIPVTQSMPHGYCAQANDDVADGSGVCQQRWMPVDAVEKLSHAHYPQVKPPPPFPVRGMAPPPEVKLQEEAPNSITGGQAPL